jgi:adenosylhomocysteinase
MSNKSFTSEDGVIKDLFERYLDYANLTAQGEKSLKLASHQLKTDMDITSRQNPRGHFTASIFLLCKKTKRVLVLEYKNLQMLLPPGGHINPKETPLQAALRRLAEETGIKDGFILRSMIPGDRDVPLNIESYTIPKNPKKGEAEHVHHSFEYLAIAEDENPVTIKNSDDKSYEWKKWDDFAAQEQFQDVATKIDGLAYRRSAGAFYESLFDQKTIDIIQKNDYNCLALQHIIPSTVKFILFLKTVFGDNLQILAKPKSIDKEILNQLKNEGVDVVVANRTDNFEKYITGKTILMDIGGYFTRIAKKKGLPIVGIVENNQNGLEKYQSIKGEVKYPVVTVAKSDLRETEDKLAGEAMVHAANTILRQQNVMIDYCRCGVIGYGQIGSGIAQRLVKRGVTPYVSDTNPVKLVKAVNDYCYVVDTEYLVSHSSVIFSATGNVGLTSDILKKVKKGAYIVSAAPCDYEIDVIALEKGYRAEKVSDTVTKYIGERNYFHLLNDGNSISYLFGGVPGPFVYLMLGEELAVVDSLINTKKYRPGVHLSQEDTKPVAILWIREFIRINR